MNRRPQPERSTWIAELFDRCVDLDPEARARLLDDVLEGADDAEAIRAEVIGLLEFDSSETAPLTPLPLSGSLGELVRAADDALQVPASAPFGGEIPGYAIGRRIGEGAMGDVYEATQETPRRRVALKVLKRSAMDERVQRRFEFEAEVLGRLEHDGIARVIEAGTFHDEGLVRPFFAMEYVEGTPLNEHVRAETIGFRAVAALLADVGDAVHHAHTRGVVHRDLKPGNVLVLKDGHPKVLDFGVAHVASEDRASAIQTMDGQVIGTLAYMSPEQARGESASVDARSDVYSLGVLLYEALSGQIPIEVDGAPVHTAIRSITEVEPVPLTRTCPGVDKDLATIVHKALSKEPRSRYGSASEFSADLRRYLRFEPVVARPATVAYQLARFARRHRSLVAASSATLVGLVVSLVVALVALDQVERARQQEETERKRAQAESATHRAIDQFILRDMLQAASPMQQGRDIKVVDILKAARPRVASAFRDQPEVRSAVELTLGTTYRELGLWEEAAELIDASVEGHRALYGDRDERTVLALYEQFLAEVDPGTSARLARVRELKDLFEEVFGKDDPESLRLSGDLGVLLAMNGRFDEAIDQTRSTLERCQRLLGPRHPRTLMSHRKHADALEAAGRWQEVEAERRAFVDVVTKELGIDHPERIKASDRLGRLLINLGRYDEALPVIEEAIDASTRVFGPNSAEALRLRFSLVKYHDQVRDLEAAEAESRELVRLLEETLGGDHSMTLTARSDLAINLRRQKKFEEAESIALEVLEQRKSRGHLDGGLLADSYAAVAAIYIDREELGKADEYLGEALREGERAYGSQHPAFADILFNYGQLLMLRDEYERAEANYRRLIEVDSKARGADHPYVASELHNLGRALQHQGRHAEALVEFERAMAMHAVLGSEESRVATATTVEIGATYVDLGRFEDAEALFAGLHDRLTRDGREDWIERYSLRKRIGDLLSQMGRADDAAMYDSKQD